MHNDSAQSTHQRRGSRPPSPPLRSPMWNTLLTLKLQWGGCKIPGTRTRGTSVRVLGLGRIFQPLAAAAVSAATGQGGNKYGSCQRGAPSGVWYTRSASTDVPCTPKLGIWSTVKRASDTLCLCYQPPHSVFDAIAEYAWQVTSGERIVRKCVWGGCVTPNSHVNDAALQSCVPCEAARWLNAKLSFAETTKA